MATVYADAAGAVVMLLRDADDEAMFPVAPPGAAASLAFDEATNASLLAALGATPGQFSYLNGALSRNGQAVTVVAPGPDYQTRHFALQVADALVGTPPVPNPGLAALRAVQAGTATNAQAQAVLAFEGRLLGYVIQRLLASAAI